MRMWNVDPSKMCRQHLLGEHLEMHMFVGALAKNKMLSGYINGGLVHIANICNRHDQLVKEMVKRGYKHKTPVMLPKTLGINLIDYETNNINIEENEKELHNRCNNCNF